jgi:cell division protein YceG involved in septum cleavage
MTKNVYEISNRKFVIASRARFRIFLAVVIIALAITMTAVIGRPAADAVTEPQTVSYTVESGDTVWSIAEEYTSDEDDVRQMVYNICEENNIDDSSITEGQKLVIPLD